MTFDGVSLFVENRTGGLCAAIYEDGSPHPGGCAEGNGVLERTLGDHCASLHKRP